MTYMVNKIYFFKPLFALSPCFFILLVYLLLTAHEAKPQGCSDAGFCTMGAMRPNQHYSTKTNLKLRSVEFSQYIGYTKFDDIILNYSLDANFSVGNRNTLQIKMPYQFVYGKLGKAQGTGDISLSFTRNILATRNYQVNASVGTKIPTMTPNLTAPDGRPLPMYHQTSLGTYDLIAGISFMTRHWLIATGYQQALNAAGNEFTWTAWKGSDKENEALQFPVSKNILRGKDVMLRIERNFRSSKFNAYLGLLGIYRLTKDQVFSPKEQKVVEQDGTTGLALTGLAGAGYNITAKTSIKAMFGHRILEREKNPDGLTREWVQTIGIEYKF
jgi:hypothetical protein